MGPTIGLMQRCIRLEARRATPRTGFETNPRNSTQLSKAVYTESSVESDVLAASAAESFYRLLSRLQGWTIERAI